jgi:hypothetical protein
MWHKLDFLVRRCSWMMFTNRRCGWATSPIFTASRKKTLSSNFPMIWNAMVFALPRPAALVHVSAYVIVHHEIIPLRAIL